MNIVIKNKKLVKKLLSGIVTFFIFTAVFMSCTSKKSALEKENTPLNIMIVTLDDMNYGHTGVEGCTVPDITPNLDKLASEGILFTHGYVMTPICGPSRNALLSGRYPHCNGMMGHGVEPPKNWQEPEILTPTITKYLHNRGYFTAAVLKNRRFAQFHVWDVAYQDISFGTGYHDRNPESFYKRTKSLIARATSLKKPFLLYVNPIDPHRPWPGTDEELEKLPMYNPDRPGPKPSREYTAKEVEVPNFIPDTPEVRKNLIPYYESVHRGDECVGEILKALDESGMADNTLVVFLSDHGMAVIGGKTTLYHNGIRVPIILKLPGKIKAGVIDKESIISSIDIVPTIIDALGLPEIKGIEGMSFYDVLTGKSAKSTRKYAYAESNYLLRSTEDEFFPRRAIIDKEFDYIWNSYVVRSGGKKKFHRWYTDVVQSALNGDYPRFSEKVDRITKNQPVEELYDLNKDPGCWNNLAQNPEYSKVLSKYRTRLLKEMESTADPELPIVNFK